MRHLLILLCLAVLATGCGFHPRGTLAVSEGLGPVRVTTADPYSPLAQGLSTALARAGATPAVEGQPASTLAVLRERLATRPLSVDRRAQVREYETTYVVEFELRGPDGKRRLARQTVELSREYSYDPFASAGSPAEQELIEEELQRDMHAAILRRLDIALRAD